MGNLLGNPQVGMLFINFEKPHRLRLQGIASIDDNDPLLQEYAEAQLVVRVTVRASLAPTACGKPSEKRCRPTATLEDGQTVEIKNGTIFSVRPGQLPPREGGALRNRTP
jgi:hypothetical protein